MDLNGDGAVDILSGSYSREGNDMAGTFQVLWGKKDRTFKKPEELKGTDGQPLIITTEASSQSARTDKICTRPFAVDLDGDGKLDIVAGNFTGTFALFRGEGKGKFAPNSTWLQGSSGPLRVEYHGDPCFVDWDGDGDLDLVSGSARGGAYLFPNEGDKKQPKFGEQVTLLAPAGHDSRDVAFGDAHLKAPQADTRVWADDVNGDGKIDVLIGDTATVVHPAQGVAEAAARKELAAWQERQNKLMKSSQAANGEQTEADQRRLQKDYEELRKEREKIVRDERTGFVWVMYRK